MDYGILLQIQASCYRSRHPATDSGTCYRFRHLLQIQALATGSGTCYRFRHSAIDSGNLLQSHAICYRVMQSATESCNLLQSCAICYRVMQSATGSGNLLQGQAICYMVMQFVTGIIFMLCIFQYWFYNGILVEIASLGMETQIGSII